ncbi:MAG: zinc-finger domain-containing protein [Rhodospirillaceae bacterium]
MKESLEKTATDPVEIIGTDRAAVDCDGGGGALGHPHVYLSIKPEEGQIDCPYCSRRFVLQSSAAAAH